MTDLTLVIGNKAYSSWSLRPWLAMTVAGIPFEEVVVPLWQDGSREAVLAVSPAGKLPVLRHGPVMVWESLAICSYLAELFPDKGLWPADRAARALALSVSHEMHAGFQPLRQAMPMNCRSRRAAPLLSPAVAADVARIQALWGDCRRRFGAGGPFLFGSFGIADAMYAPVVCRFAGYGVALDDGAAAYRDAILALPAMRRWHAEAAAEPWVVARFEDPAA
jgi:glutathione S-transferase